METWRWLHPLPFKEGTFAIIQASFSQDN